MIMLRNMRETVMKEDVRKMDLMYISHACTCIYNVHKIIYNVLPW